MNNADDRIIVGVCVSSSLEIHLKIVLINEDLLGTSASYQDVLPFFSVIGQYYAHSGDSSKDKRD